MKKKGIIRGTTRSGGTVILLGKGKKVPKGIKILYKGRRKFYSNARNWVLAS
ncbi:hypothetical protein [Persephonella sp.]